MNKVKVLFFAADPLSAEGSERRLLLDHEVRDIKAAIKAALHRDRIEFLTCEATRVDDLRREMLAVKPQIVHFSGHGGSEGLVLEDEDGRPHRVGGNALQRFFSALPYRPRVVVLNSCHSKQEADAIAKVIECAIGYPRRILDDHARAFSRAFYSSIAFGQSVGAAFEQARTTLEMKSCPDDELPELVPREAFDASGLVLVRPSRQEILRTIAVITACAVAALIYDPPPDPCATAREVGRAAVAAGTRVPTRVNHLGASAAAGNPLHAPQELVEANDLHRRGDHVADFPLFRKAAEAGSEEAMTLLGLAYLDGKGTPVQRDSGVEWLRQAAGKGDPRGMSELGSAYLRGYAGPRDLDYWARHWFHKAAAEDYPEAMANLGTIYREGLGVDRDSALALDWYQRAARRGVVDAMVEIGWMYDEGLAVAPNEKQAVCWYRAASKAGSARGRQALERLRN